jgi:hypothetical protein
MTTQSESFYIKLIKLNCESFLAVIAHLDVFVIRFNLPRYTDSVDRIRWIFKSKLEPGSIIFY